MMNSIFLSASAIEQVGGGTIAIVGYLIVFVALIVLVGIFMLVPKIIRMMVAKKNAATCAGTECTPPQKKPIDMDAQTNAAIAAALHLYFDEMHDFESNVITIRTANKQYSPWNSKIYGVMNQPVKK